MIIKRTTLFAAILLLAWVHAASAAISVIQQFLTGTTGSSLTFTPGTNISNLTAGNAILLTVAGAQLSSCLTAPNFTDTFGDTFVVDASTVDATSQLCIEWVHAFNVHGGATTITVNVSGFTIWAAGVGAEVSGLNGTFDQHASTTCNTACTGSWSTGTTGALLSTTEISIASCAMTGSGAPWSISSGPTNSYTGFTSMPDSTNISGQGQLQSAYLLTSSASATSSAYTMTGSNALQWDCGVVTYEGTASATGQGSVILSSVGHRIALPTSLGLDLALQP